MAFAAVVVPVAFTVEVLKVDGFGAEVVVAGALDDGCTVVEVVALTLLAELDEADGRIVVLTVGAAVLLVLGEGLATIVDEAFEEAATEEVVAFTDDDVEAVATGTTGEATVEVWLCV